MTEQGGTAAEDELWTPGQAADYLNAGGVHLGFTPRRVTDMVKRGELSGVQTHRGGWRRTPASEIRALRADQLSALGRTDPEAGRHHRPSDPQGDDQGDDQAR